MNGISSVIMMLGVGLFFCLVFRKCVDSVLNS